MASNHGNAGGQDGGGDQGSTAALDLTFESALADLETVVRELEAGQVDLLGSIRHYQRGVALLRHCQSLLREAEAKLDVIAIEDGQPVPAGARES